MKCIIHLQGWLFWAFIEAEVVGRETNHGGKRKMCNLLHKSSGYKEMNIVILEYKQASNKNLAKVEAASASQ